MTAAPLFAAARLTDLGLSALLGMILVDRVIERLRHRRQPLANNRFGAVDVDAVIATGLFFVASAFAVLTLPLTHYLFQWPPHSHVPQPLLLLTIWCRGLAATAMIYGLAHYPRRQMLCCAGWAIMAHIFILGPAVWAQIQ